MNVEGQAAVDALKAMDPVRSDTVRIDGTKGGLKLSAVNLATNLRVIALVPMKKAAKTGTWILPRQPLIAWSKSGDALKLTPGKSTVTLSGDNFEAKVPFSTEDQGPDKAGKVGKWYDMDSKSLTGAIRPCLWAVGARVVRPALHTIRLTIDDSSVTGEGVSGFSYAKSQVQIETGGPSDPVVVLLDASDAASLAKIEFDKLGFWPDGEDVRGIRVRSSIADYEMRALSVDYPDLETFIGPLVEGIGEEQTWVEPEELSGGLRTLIGAVAPTLGSPLDALVSSTGTSSIRLDCKGQWDAHVDVELSGEGIESDNRFKVGQMLQASETMVGTSNIKVSDKGFVVRSEVSGVERTALLTCMRK